MNNPNQQPVSDSKRPHARQSLLSRPVAAISLALGVVAAGYLDLIRGGMTLSATLLSLGYLIFVPIAIMAVKPEQRHAVRVNRRK